MKQTTAVEWLIDQVEDYIGLIPVDIIEQAKEMEKQQIVDAYNEGGCNWDSELEAEQYYNDTFREIEKL
jgi:hypothetical protein